MRAHEPRRRRPGGPPAGPQRRGSLIVVGTGISLVGHATLAAVEAIRRADKLFYLVTEPAAEAWIRRLNPSATTLEDCYGDGKPRLRTYREMTDRIVNAVRAGLDVCVAFYGHPGVFVQSTHDAVRRARREGFSARMLPGISTEDCLFADLGVDPCSAGCQSYEATDFLLFRRRFDPTSALILWQVGVLGESAARKDMSSRPERLKVLAASLGRHYPTKHPVVLYEAAQFPVCEPVIRRVPLGRLSAQTILPMTTLYVPPRPPRGLDPKVVRWLEAR